MAKNTTRRPTTMGAERANLIACCAARMVPHVRAAHGLASALLAIYQPRLALAEETAFRLGRSPSTSDDAGPAYARACQQVEELRGLVAIVKAADDELNRANYDTGRLLSLTKGGAK